MKETDDAGYKYRGIPHYDKVKQTEMREILVLKSKLNKANETLPVNTLAVAALQYSAVVL